MGKIQSINQSIKFKRPTGLPPLKKKKSTETTGKPLYIILKQDNWSTSIYVLYISVSMPDTQHTHTHTQIRVAVSQQKG